MPALVIRECENMCERFISIDRFAVPSKPLFATTAPMPVRAYQRVLFSSATASSQTTIQDRRRRHCAQRTMRRLCALVRIERFLFRMAPQYKRIGIKGITGSSKPFNYDLLLTLTGNNANKVINASETGPVVAVSNVFALLPTSGPCMR